MQDRRKEERTPVDAQGFFLRDGIMSEIKIRDAAPKGIGALACQELKSGQQGVLVARLPDSLEADEIPSEVCWCFHDPMSSDPAFSYRVGLRLLVDP